MHKPSIQKYTKFWNEKTYNNTATIYRLAESGILENVGVDYVEMEPNNTLKAHYHDLPSVVILVIDGKGVAHLDGKEHPIEKGDVITIPPKTSHGFSTQGNSLHFLSIQTPAIYGEDASKDTHFI
jgi:quercetin dioxygenase-like cupin family protein